MLSLAVYASGSRSPTAPRGIVRGHVVVAVNTLRSRLAEPWTLDAGPRVRLCWEPRSRWAAARGLDQTVTHARTLADQAADLARQATDGDASHQARREVAALMRQIGDARRALRDQPRVSTATSDDTRTEAESHAHPR